MRRPNLKNFKSDNLGVVVEQFQKSPHGMDRDDKKNLTNEETSQVLGATPIKQVGATQGPTFEDTEEVVLDTLQ